MGDLRPLGDVAEITPGPSGSLLDDLEVSPEGIPVVSPSDITVRHTVDARQLRRVPAQHASKLSRFFLAEGDVLIVRQGALGRTALIGADCDAWIYNSSCLRIRARQGLLVSRYLIAALAYPPILEILLGRASPGTVPSIKTEALNGLLIPVPDLRTQETVAEVASEIEDQIEVHQKIVEKLFELKPAMFGDLVGEVHQYE